MNEGKDNRTALEISWKEVLELSPFAEIWPDLLSGKIIPTDVPLSGELKRRKN